MLIGRLSESRCGSRKKITKNRREKKKNDVLIAVLLIFAAESAFKNVLCHEREREREYFTLPEHKSRCPYFCANVPYDLPSEVARKRVRVWNLATAEQYFRGIRVTTANQIFFPLSFQSNLTVKLHTVCAGTAYSIRITRLGFTNSIIAILDKQKRNIEKESNVW